MSLDQGIERPKAVRGILHSVEHPGATDLVQSTLPPLWRQCDQGIDDTRPLVIGAKFCPVKSLCNRHFVSAVRPAQRCEVHQLANLQHHSAQVVAHAFQQLRIDSVGRKAARVGETSNHAVTCCNYQITLIESKIRGVRKRTSIQQSTAQCDSASRYDLIT